MRQAAVAKKPLLAITMGDAGGIGPEVVIKAVARQEVRRLCDPVLIGDPAVFRKCLKFLPRPIVLFETAGLPPLRSAGGGIPVIMPCAAIDKHRWGVVRKSYGGSAMECVKFAVEMALHKRVDAVVTAPISKEAIHRAGYRFQGHTEYIARLTGTKRYAMMLTGRGLNVVLVTIHAAIARVSGLLSRKRIVRAIELADEACRRLGMRRPRIAVCALNPHAGEAGAFGREEIEKIIPAIRDAAGRGIHAQGPFPADTLFVDRVCGRFDAVVAMYHDQGLIPLKMRAFDVGVNVTLGLPIVRTSPDHGTAYDIAGKGIADPSSMVEAIKLAARMSARSDD